MATRPRITKYPVILNGNMSGNISGTPSIIQDLTLIGYALSWSGTAPVGTASIQVSNDYALDGDGRTVSNAGTWTTITLNYNGSAVTSIPITGNTGTAYIDIDSHSAYAMQLIYNATSGTGTLQAIVNAKVA